MANQIENGQIYQQPVKREIWRHEAELTGLTPNLRIPYQVTSIREDAEKVSSEVFTLAPSPKSGTLLKILLTSELPIIN